MWKRNGKFVSFFRSFIGSKPQKEKVDDEDNEIETEEIEDKPEEKDIDAELAKYWKDIFESATWGEGKDEKLAR